LAGEGHSNEEELEEKRVWAENPAEVIANTEAIMDHEGLKDYYPTVYYTVNILLAHERYRAGSDLGELATAAAILPDAHMHETTGQELQTAGTIEKALSDEHREDEKMLRNLSVFGDVPAKDIPDAFAISRNKVSEFEQHAITAEKELYTQTGIFLPIGFHGGRSWPYMNASLPPTDERAYHRELHDLQNGRTKLAERELERERDELETRIEYASQGVAALKLLSRVEEAVSDSRYCLQLVKSLQEQESARTRDK
jgi:transcriptional regulator of met regulon